MDKLEWCKKQSKGIRLIDPNNNLSKAYLLKSEKSLESMAILNDKDWKISAAYYSMYFSLYAILMKIGVKCEIHVCTILFAEKFLKDSFTKEDIDFLNESMKARIDSQYYVNKEVDDEMYDEMIKRAPEFVLRCKTINSKITEKKISEIRDRLVNSF
jgi:uncharacterized protein (UPF0332 family)